MRKSLLAKDTLGYAHQCILEDYRVPPTLAARRLAMPYTKFVREADSSCSSELSLRTLIEYMLATDDVRILEFIANSLGYRLMEDEESTATLEYASPEIDSMSIPTRVATELRQ